MFYSVTEHCRRRSMLLAAALSFFTTSPANTSIESAMPPGMHARSASVTAAQRPHHVDTAK